MSDFPLLWRMDGIKGGQPCIRGTGIIAEVLAGMFAAGDSIQSIAVDYGIEEEAVIQCVRLMLTGCYGRQGLLADVDRRMTAQLPLETR